MKIVDRYIASLFVGPFIVGVGAFAAIITGVSEIYWAVQLVVRDGVPSLLALQAFLLHLPQIIAMTMPMASVFAALMASGELSSHGESIAMRAGGISLLRMAQPILLAGLVVSVATLLFNEAIGPPSNARSERIVRDYLTRVRDVEKHIMLRVPEEGEAQRVIYADKLDPAKAQLINITIIEFADGKPAHVFFADRAQWDNKQWVLHNFVHKQYTGNGYREWSGAVRLYDMGRTPEEIRGARRWKPEAMSLRRLREEVKNLQARGREQKDGRNRPAWLLQHYHIRLATPWAGFCFCLLGFPLGLRPQRTSTGIGFGISLAIVFAYYIVMNSLRAFGEQGAISPVLAAWLPNVVVGAVGAGLMLNAHR